MPSQLAIAYLRGAPKRQSCQACYGSVTTKKRVGHCLISGKCARLRTIERRKRNGVSPLKIFLRFRQVLSKIALTCRSWETRIAREDAMPHERGLMPVPPPEIFCNPLADPKTRFCRPLANRQLQAQPHLKNSGNSLTLRHLITARDRCQTAWLSPGLRMFPCHLIYSERRTVQLRSTP